MRIIAIYLLLGGIVSLLSYLITQKELAKRDQPIVFFTWLSIIVIWPCLIIELFIETLRRTD